MHFPKLATCAVWAASLTTAGAVAAAGAMTVFAEAPACTKNGQPVATAEAEANPEECDPGTGPLAASSEVEVTATSADGGDTPPADTEPTEVAPEPVTDPAPDPATTDPAPDGGTTGEGETATGGTQDPVTDGATDGAGATDPAPAPPTPDPVTPSPDPTPETGAADPGRNADGGRKAASENKGERSAQPAAPAATPQQRQVEAKIAKVVRFQDARTFREKFSPRGRIPETPRLEQPQMGALLAAAKDARVDWSLLAGVAWLDSKWGNKAAGGFAATRLDAKVRARYATDGNGDGKVNLQQPADALATAAELLAAKRAELGSMDRALRFYYGNRRSHVRRVRFLGAYYDALGTDAIVHGLSEADVRTGLAKRVLADKRVQMYSGGRSDIDAGLIDPRVLVTLEFLANRHGSVTVSSLVSGHSVFTASGNVSLHSFGQAVDIAALGGTSILGNQGRKSVTVKAVRDVLLMPKSMQPSELISLWDLGGPSFALADHHDHIHIGYKTEGQGAAPAGAAGAGAHTHDE